MPVQLSVDQRPIHDLARKLKTAENGKVLRKELITQLRGIAEPMANAARGAIRSAPGSGSHPGISLRGTVASSIKPQVRLSGKNTGLAIRARTTPQVRGFRFAGRNFNRATWRHPVFGSGTWVVQVGRPQWFDLTLQAYRGTVRREVATAVDQMAARVAAQTTTRGI